MINALSKLKCCVARITDRDRDLLKAPKEYGGPATSQIQTEVFQLPCAIRGDRRQLHQLGAADSSGSEGDRRARRREDGPGVIARILLPCASFIGRRVALSRSSLEPTWNYSNPINRTWASAEGINGKAVTDLKDKDGKVIRAAGQQLDGFAQLRDDGSTSCGNWISPSVRAADHGN